VAGDKIIALRLAYLGWEYHGIVKQPGLRTIQQELEKALLEQGVKAKLRFTSRTDKGVSAIDNVAIFRGPKPTISRLNSSLPDDITVWAVSAIDKPVAPLKKTYLYVIPFKVDVNRLTNEIARSFREARLCKEGKAPLPDQYRVERANGYTKVFISGRSFCWQMIRRIIGFALSHAIGIKMDLAPPEPLVLIKTELPIKWEEFYYKKLIRIKNFLEKESWRWVMRLELIAALDAVISLEQ